jgi:hypothetical protein
LGYGIFSGEDALMGGASMGSISTQQSVFTSKATLAGLLDYLQQAYPVRDFPPAHDSIWEELVFRIASDEELGTFLSWNFNIKEALDDVTMINLETERIYVDARDGYAKTFERCFPEVLRRMADISFMVENFLQFT